MTYCYQNDVAHPEQANHPVSFNTYDLSQLPTNKHIWHGYLIRWNAESSSLGPDKMPCVHFVGPLPDGHWVVAVNSRIEEQFKERYREDILDKIEAGDHVLRHLFTPNDKDIDEHGLEVAARKTRSDVLSRAVEGVTAPGCFHLYRYYKTIIPDKADLLQVEWARLGYELQVSAWYVESLHCSHRTEVRTRGRRKVYVVNPASCTKFRRRSEH